MNTHRYKQTVAEFILHLSAISAGHVFVFFSSARVLEKIQQHLQKTQMWDRIEFYKQIMVETVLGLSCRSFIDSHRGDSVVLFSVMGTKAADAIGFSEVKTSNVAIVGVPIPPQKVKWRKLLADYRRNTGMKQTDCWYTERAMSTVSQTIERSISWLGTANVFLCDRRFSQKRYISRLCCSVTANVTTHTSHHTICTNKKESR
ncbi:MAG: uncharacterized protein A8A55_2984 [Amphiamblys sp. WSBS2006]|nr:MAG: uncharacterized protein A8A55_2984 [Amphiamblys sp. WSBS2006]